MFQVKLADSDIEYISRGKGQSIIILPGGSSSITSRLSFKERAGDSVQQKSELNFEQFSVAAFGELLPNEHAAMSNGLHPCLNATIRSQIQNAVSPCLDRMQYCLAR